MFPLRDRKSYLPVSSFIDGQPDDFERHVDDDTSGVADGADEVDGLRHVNLVLAVEPYLLDLFSFS